MPDVYDRLYRAAPSVIRSWIEHHAVQIEQIAIAAERSVLDSIIRGEYDGVRWLIEGNKLYIKTGYNRPLLKIEDSNTVDTLGKDTVEIPITADHLFALEAAFRTMSAVAPGGAALLAEPLRDVVFGHLPSRHKRSTRPAGRPSAPVRDFGCGGACGLPGSDPGSRQRGLPFFPQVGPWA